MANEVTRSAVQPPTSEDRYMEEIAEKAKRKAEQIRMVTEKSMNMDDHLLSLKYWWSSFYNRPMKDPILDEYSMYDLYLEFYLHTFSKEASTSEMISENKEELQDLFKEFESAPGEDFFGPDDQTPLSQASQEDTGWSMTESDFT